MFRLRALLFLTLLSIACFSHIALAQHPYFYNINDDAGLPSNEVYQLTQDDFGYMWIGCDAGLFRYDGFRFQQYKNQAQNAVAISGLRKAGKERLLCQNFSGQIFYTQNDSLLLLADVKGIVRSHPEYTIDNSGNVWIGLPNGILKYNVDGTKEYLFKNELSVYEIEISADGEIFVLDTKKGLLCITKKAPNKYAIAAIKDDNHVIINGSSKIRKYGSRVFVLSTNSLAHYHDISEIKENKLTLLKKIDINTFAEFAYTISLIDNKLWLGTSNGVYRMNLSGEIEDHYFKGEKISDIYVDREGTYWFSSLQNGIFAIPHLNLTLLNKSNSGIKDNNVTALRCLPELGILMGTYTGDIYRYSPYNGNLSILPKSNGVVYRNVTSIIPYGANTIIAGRGNLSLINIPSKTERKYPSIYIRDMAMMGDSIFCMSTHGISAVCNVSKLVSKNIYHAEIIKNVAAKKVCYDEQGKTLWVTVNEGLARLEGKELRLFPVNGKPVFCNALYSDNVGLWAGTIADGLYNIRRGKVALHLNNTNGLRGHNIKCITSQNGTLYVATDECINIRHENGSFDYITHADGINAKEVNAISIDSSYIYIGTIRGLFYVPVNTVFRNNVKPNIRITSVSIEGIKQDVGQVIRLPHENKDVLINFAATALRSRGQFSYLYRIHGFQESWKKLDGNIDNIRLNHLPPGSFVFEVKAINENGTESGNVAKAMFMVSAPFWEQWWFYIFIALVTSAFVTLVFVMRIRAIKRNADIREQVTNSQLTALKAQMNPHFMYNTLNSIQDLVLQSDIKNTNYYLSRYSTLMRKILDTSENKEIELTEEAEILQLYLELEQLRFGKDFTFTINRTPEIEKAAIQIPSMIIQPFVENAIKHGLLHKRGNKHLSITFAMQGNILLCNIKDNGVGRVKAGEIKLRSPLQHKSFATRATEKRLELININRKHKIQLHIDDLYEHGIAIGTEVKLKIPLS